MRFGKIIFVLRDFDETESLEVCRRTIEKDLHDIWNKIEQKVKIKFFFLKKLFLSQKNVRGKNLLHFLR